MSPIPQLPFHFLYNGLFLTLNFQMKRPHIKAPSPNDATHSSKKKNKVRTPCMFPGL